MNPNGDEHAATTAPDVRAEGTLATGERFRPVVLAGLTLVLIALCAWLAVPFLPALAWAVALAIIAWPLHERLARRIPRETLAAALTTLAVIVVILAPGLFVTYQLAREAGSAAEQIEQQRQETLLRDRMAGSPVLGRAVVWMDRVGVDIDRAVRRIVSRLNQDAAGVLEGSLAALLQFAVMLYILFHLFRDRATLLRGVRALLPTTPAESERLFAGVADSVHANLYATAVTSAIDGIGGGLIFWLLGLPSPATWGVVMFVLSIVPVLGTWLVWLPAAAYLLLTGHWPQALILLLWGVASWFVVDSIIYVRIAGERMRLHEVPTLLAFLGGLVLFGASGMILGPAILAITVAVVQVWHKRANSETAAQMRAASQIPNAAECSAVSA